MIARYLVPLIRRLFVVAFTVYMANTGETGVEAAVMLLGLHGVGVGWYQRVSVGFGSIQYEDPAGLGVNLREP